MTITRLDHLPELDDPILQDLRRRVQQTKPHQPQPGDPDYLTPEQIARILHDRAEEDDRGIL